MLPSAVKHRGEPQHKLRRMTVKPQSRRMARATPWQCHSFSPAAHKGASPAKPSAHHLLVCRMRTGRSRLLQKLSPPSKKKSPHLFESYCSSLQDEFCLDAAESPIVPLMKGVFVGTNSRTVSAAAMSGARMAETRIMVLPFLLNPQNLALACLFLSFFLQSCSHSKANIKNKVHPIQIFGYCTYSYTLATGNAVAFSASIWLDVLRILRKQLFSQIVKKSNEKWRS